MSLNSHRVPKAPPRGRPKSNVEFLTDLMEFGNPLKQAIIMEAVGRYAKDVVTSLDPDNPPHAWPGIISPHAWHQCAKEIDAAFTERLGQ